MSQDDTQQIYDGDVAPAAAATPPPESKPDLPRNPDGTFAPRVHEHAPGLVELARDFGLDDAEIAELDGRALSNQVLRLQRQQAKFRDHLDKANLLTNTSPPRQAPPPAAAAESQDELAFLEELEEHGLDKKMSGLMRRLHKENKELRDKLGGIEQRDTHRETVRVADMIDSGFEALGADYHPHFGEGTASEIGLDSLEYKRRCAVVSQSGILQTDGPASVRRKIRQTTQDLNIGPKAAAKATEPYAQAVQPAKPANGAAAKRITKEQWNDAALKVPASREVDDMPEGEAKAKRNLARRLGVEATETGEELDGFLE